MNKKKYRFVGAASSQILGTPYNFTQFGQLVALPDDVAVAAVAGHINLVRDEDFTLTEADVTKYMRFESHSTAPPDFLEKRAALWELAAAYHIDAQSILTGLSKSAAPQEVKPNE